MHPVTIYVKITNPKLSSEWVWFTSAIQNRRTPHASVVWLNNMAARRGIPATYELATEAEYWEYRHALQASLQSS